MKRVSGCASPIAERVTRSEEANLRAAPPASLSAKAGLALQHRVLAVQVRSRRSARTDDLMHEDEWVERPAPGCGGTAEVRGFRAHHRTNPGVRERHNLTPFVSMGVVRAGRSFRLGQVRSVARLVDRGLVRRASADADARGVVVALTNAGVARLTETAPVYARGISELFVAQLQDHELAALESMLHTVTLDCSFG